MASNLTLFRVTDVHGRWTFEVPIEDDRLIIVGENGSGKTTLMNIMYYFLSGQWGRLREFQFGEITTIAGGDTISVPRTELYWEARRPRYSRARWSPSVRRRLASYRMSMPHDVVTPADIERVARKLGLPVRAVTDFLEAEGSDESEDGRKRALVEQKRKRLTSAFKAQVLYLPTYRRIEQELSFIFPGLDPDELPGRSRRTRRSSDESDYVELVEFGMQDVSEKIESRIASLKESVREGLSDLTQTYLRDLIDGEYRKVDLDRIRRIDDGTIRAVVDRIDERLLPDLEKRRLREIIGKIRKGDKAEEHMQVIAHFFLRLLALQQEQTTREEHILQFAEVCNAYLEPTKALEYDSNEIKLSIAVRDPDQSECGPQETEVELQHLSSGEKQIVSLFSHLYLSARKRFFVLIDEPELSLSVPWQKRFLVDIAEGGFCDGLIAVTHSPFTYDNSLDRHARGLLEFRRPSGTT